MDRRVVENKKIIIVIEKQFAIKVGKYGKFYGEEYEEERSC